MDEMEIESGQELEDISNPKNDLDKQLGEVEGAVEANEVNNNEAHIEQIHEQIREAGEQVSDQVDQPKNNTPSNSEIGDRQKLLELSHKIMLREPNGKRDVVGEIVYKDQISAVVQVNKKYGYRVDANAIQGHALNERVAVIFAEGRQISMKEVDYNKRRENERALSVEMDNEGAGIDV